MRLCKKRAKVLNVIRVLEEELWRAGEKRGIMESPILSADVMADDRAYRRTSTGWIGLLKALEGAYVKSVTLKTDETTGLVWLEIEAI